MQIKWKISALLLTAVAIAAVAAPAQQKAAGPFTAAQVTAGRADIRRRHDRNLPPAGPA